MHPHPNRPQAVAMCVARCCYEQNTPSQTCLSPLFPSTSAFQTPHPAFRTTTNSGSTPAPCLRQGRACARGGWGVRVRLLRGILRALDGGVGRPLRWGGAKGAGSKNMGGGQPAATSQPRGGGGVGTRPWWLALLACGSAYWPLAFEPSAMTSGHPHYCGHPHFCGHLHYCGHPPAWGGIQNATSAHGVLP